MDGSRKNAAFSIFETLSKPDGDMFRIRLFFILLAAIGSIACADAQAVRRDSAKAFQKVRECSAQMGPNVITFSFYQPTQSRDQFCEDVPETGPTTIVIDTMQDELRDMMVEIRIVEAAPKWGRRRCAERSLSSARAVPDRRDPARTRLQETGRLRGARCGRAARMAGKNTTPVSSFRSAKSFCAPGPRSPSRPPWRSLSAWAGTRTPSASERRKRRRLRNA